jgi:hypothetical protein
MTRSLALLLIAALACALVTAACGGGEGGDAPPPTSAPSGEGTGASGPAVEQAVENCKRSTEQQPGISPDVKSELLEICEEAAKGDEQDVRKATRQVCVKLIEENVPAGIARQQALASCEQSTPAP